MEHVAPPGGWSPTPALDDEEETSGRKKGPAVMEQDGGKEARVEKLRFSFFH